MTSLLTSAFSQLAERLGRRHDSEAPEADDEATQPMARLPEGFRLTRWPHLPGDLRTARMMGALSVMTQRWVTVRWFAHQLSWPEDDAHAFLNSLVRTGSARRIGE